MKNELDLRIEKIESKLSSPAGTCISRTLDDSNGLKWVIGFGQMSMPKSFFYGNTIEECIEKAEKAFLKKETVGEPQYTHRAKKSMENYGGR